MTKRRILLHDIDTAVLVVEAPTDVVYRNQVGGPACFQAEQEGLLAPLEGGEELLGAMEALDFPEARRGPTPGLADLADLIDRALRSNAATAFLTVDRGRIRDSLEAWVYVAWPATPTSLEPASAIGYYGPLYGFDAGRGVLTWPNSD